MKTDDLIAHLAQLPPAPALSDRRRAALVLACTAAVAGVFLGIMGVRADLGAAWGNGVVMVKTALPALLFLAGLRAVMQMARPVADVSVAQRAAAGIAALAALLWLWSFAALPPAARFAEVAALSLSECIGLIVALALLPLAALIALLRQGATLAPRKSAFLAGVTAGAGAAAGYSLFCVQDNPLFFVTWYGVAIFLCGAIGALVGTRALRW